MANWLLILDEMESNGAEIYDKLVHDPIQLVYTQDLNVRLTSLTVGDTIFIYIGGDVLSKKKIDGIYDIAMLTDISGTQYTFKSINSKWRELVNSNQALLSIDHNEDPDILLAPLSSDDAEYYKQTIDMQLNLMKIADDTVIKEKGTVDPKNKSKGITFTGILSNVLGEINRNVSRDERIIEKGYIINNGVKVLRGFAPFKDLESIHEKDNEYQRDLKKSHKKSLIKFINSDNNFIPEIIYAFRSNNEDLFLKQVIINDSGTSPKNKGIIENLDVWQLTFSNNEKLYCIDGNHRFEAIRNIYNSDIPKELLVPFCIIFVPNSKEEDFVFNEPSYFFNLNGRSEPLLYGETFKYITSNLKDRVNIENSLSTYKFFDMLKKLDELQVYQINRIEYIKVEKKIETEIKNDENTEILYTAEEKKTPKDKLKETRLGELLFKVYKEFEDEIIKNDNIIDTFIGTIEDICNDKDYIDSLYIYKYCNDILPSLVLYLYYKNNQRSTNIKGELIKISQWLSIKQLSSEHFDSIEKLYSQYQQYISCKNIYIFMAMPFKPEDRVNEMNDFRENTLIPKLQSTFPNCNIEFSEIMREQK
ncbi:MAG: hypothetical protein ACRCS8_00340 [Brevinema sp.]